ncbi:MAG: aminopeptidase [Candidatus Aminicenantes bacterium]|jgi:aminopeptidase
MDQRIEKLAAVMATYSLELKKGDWVKIIGNPSALPLVKAFYKVAIEAGANPFYHAAVDDLQEILLKHGSDEQLKYIPETIKLETEKLDALLGIMGHSNTKFLTNVDPTRQALAQSAQIDIMKRFLERSAKGELKWVGTMFPMQSAAQDAEMSLTEYEDFVYAAGHLDDDDPVVFWKELSSRQAKMCQFLDTIKEIRVKAKDTDLTLKVEGRKWINCDGKKNFPDGEVFTSPLEDTVEGKILFSYPACYGGREVENVRLEFKEGKVVKADASKNHPYLEEMISMDKGASFVGEFAIGTNDNITKFTKNILFDEKIGGTIHVALGASIPETGGVNESALHWDMVCDLRVGGELYGDGTLIYKNGKFLVNI